MCDADENVKLSLKVMINKERNKVVYAVANNHFIDILLSFLTLPLGRIIKILEQHYGDEAPNIGSLSSLYNCVENLDSAHFWTEGAKKKLLNPRSSIEEEYKCLKPNIIIPPATEFFNCPKYLPITKALIAKMSAARPRDGVFTKQTSSFIISDRLHIFPNEERLFTISTIFCTTDMEEAEEVKVDFDFIEVMELLKASLTSPTPFSDVILNKTTEMKPATAPNISLHEMVNEENPNSGNFTLEALIQKSTGKVLYVVARENFIEFLFSFFNIPLGKVEHLVAGETCFKAINNLYRSATDLIDDKYFKTTKTKNRLVKPNVVHSCISKNHILRLTEEPLPDEEYNEILYFCSPVEFPKGKGSYLKGPRTYMVKDDLTVEPYGSALRRSILVKEKIPLFGVEELDMRIGLKEALSILKASLSSTSALTDALLTHNSNK